MRHKTSTTPEKLALYRETLSNKDPLKAIFERWPQNIPEALVAEIPGHLKANFYRMLKARKKIQDEERWAKEDRKEDQQREAFYAAQQRAQIQEAHRSPYAKTHVAIIDSVSRALLSLPGNKILTWTFDYQEKERPYSLTGRMDISRDDAWDQDDRAGFGHIIGKSIHHQANGGLIVRQFLKSTYVDTRDDGIARILPEKCIYGIRMCRGEISPIDAESTQRFHQTEAHTGRALSPEPGAFFGELPLFKPHLTTVGD